jgi:hypothetical protein
MLKLGLNTTPTRQAFYSTSGACISAEPGQVVNMGITNGWPPGFRRVDSFIKFLESEGSKEFYVQRTFALGDTLMLVPVVRYCEGLGWNVRARVAQEYLNLMSLLNVRSEVTRYPARGFGILMDWIVEQDVGNPELGRFHRVELYFKALGLDCPSPGELDWSCDLSKFSSKVPLESEYVVFQGQGSNRRKQLPLESIESILRKLSDSGVVVYYVGGPPELTVRSPRVHLTGMRFHFEELFPLIACARCLISVDSGPLWISHFTATPTVTILGPSAVRQRLSFHPLYPDATLPIEMNDWIGCPSCFEGAHACNGQMLCLQSNRERLAEAVLERVIKFWEN